MSPNFFFRTNLSGGLTLETPPPWLRAWYSQSSVEAYIYQTVNIQKFRQLLIQYWISLLIKGLHGQTDGVRVLLSRGSYQPDETDCCGTTPLMDALRAGFVDIAKILIQQQHVGSWCYPFMQIRQVFKHMYYTIACLQHFDTVGWMAERASGLQNIQVLICWWSDGDLKGPSCRWFARFIVIVTTATSINSCNNKILNSFW